MLLKPFCTLNYLTNLSIFFELILCCHVFLKLASHSKISCGDRHTQSLIKQDLFPWKTGPKWHLSMLHIHPYSCMGSASLHWAWTIQDMCTQPLATQPCEGNILCNKTWNFPVLFGLLPVCLCNRSVLPGSSLRGQKLGNSHSSLLQDVSRPFHTQKINESWKSHHLFQSV